MDDLNKHLGLAKIIQENIDTYVNLAEVLYNKAVEALDKGNYEDLEKFLFAAKLISETTLAVNTSTREKVEELFK